MSVFQNTANRLSDLILYTCTPRSGTTLISRLLNAHNAISFSEPDSLAMLAILYEQKRIPDEQTMSQLIACVFRMLMSHVVAANDQQKVILFKAKSNVNMLVPLIKRALPAIRHLFTYRRNVAKAIVSTEKMMAVPKFINFHTLFE